MPTFWRGSLALILHTFLILPLVLRTVCPAQVNSPYSFNAHILRAAYTTKHRHDFPPTKYSIGSHNSKNCPSGPIRRLEEFEHHLGACTMQTRRITKAMKAAAAARTPMPPQGLNREPSADPPSSSNPNNSSGLSTATQMSSSSTVHPAGAAEQADSDSTEEEALEAEE